jgi:TRAP transporter TAXI family solute receptor
MKKEVIRVRRSSAHGSGKVILAFCVALCGFLTWTGVASAEVKQLSMGTATVGGAFYNMGSPLAQCVNRALPEVNITAETTEGSTENLRLIDQKKIHLAVITPFIGFFARKGIKMFEGKPIDFRVVVRLLPNANVWAALSKSGLKSFPALRGHKVGVGPASGGMGVIARTQLAANGIDFKKDIKPLFMGAGDMAQAVADGAAVAAFLTPELTHLLCSRNKINIIRWDDKVLDAFLKQNPNFGEYTHPANSFKGVDYPVRTIDNGIQLICQKDMDEDLVYKLTKTIVENIGCIAEIYWPAKAMTAEWAASELANPFHPGAIKYFKEKGLWIK